MTESQTTYDVADAKAALMQLLIDQPIAYHPLLAQVAGGVGAGVMLSQLLYWTGKGRDPDGWIYKSQAEMEEETSLSASEQRTARTQLKKRGIIEEKRAGIPATLHYRVDLEQLTILLANPPQTRYPRNGQLVARDAEGKFTTERKTISEITPQTTPETTAERAPAAENAAGGEPTQPTEMPTPAEPPRRVQLLRKPGWQMPPNTVKVDRTTPFGNPYVVGQGEIETDLDAVIAFDGKLRRWRDEDLDGLQARLAALRGKNLACWCALGKPCHADVLLAWANADDLTNPWIFETGLIFAAELEARSAELQAHPPPRQTEAEILAGNRAASQASRERQQREPHLAWGNQSEEAKRMFAGMDERGSLRRLGYWLDVELGLHPPWKDKRAVKGWLLGLRELLEAADGDGDLALQSARELRAKGLTMADPRSIVKTAASMAAERRSGAPHINGGKGNRQTVPRNARCITLAEMPPPVYEERLPLREGER